jgi:alpha-amylase/alpha-mannosidase (GH57 family)
MTRVAILWHMHQPFYEDLITHEHILPWVRLHALKDYYGMVALMREFPKIKATFNLVPSLLVQLDAFARDRARDRYLELSLKPAEELNAQDIAFMVENFFHAQRARMIEPYPRYSELLAHRNGSLDVDELRDLQVWQKLAWIDPLYLDADPRIRALIARDRDFSEDDKAILRSVELEILNKVVPEYRSAAARGQIEISASPFYHPILPLLCDTDVYLTTHPDAKRPRQRFVHPEDAAAQLTRAAAYHEQLFGRKPVGLWPSEGSVSDAMVPLVANSGFEWMATDEQILARTLGVTFSRDAAGHVEQPQHLYAAHKVRVRGATVSCAFRDHVLSDLIGFTYASWSADAAADDFVARLAEAGRRYAQRGGKGEPLIPIILDGENAWEHFEGGGRPFLRALYRRLSDHPELRTVTMREGCADAMEELTTIFPGSWIDANFYIWIGHADDQRAWSQLADARQALDGPTTASPTAAAEAREEVFVAEGSDWCWWYGDDHSSAHDLEFDDLFRRHLRNVYRLLQLPVPDDLFISNISTGAASPVQTEPTELLSPTFDGEETSYFEWLGAGSFGIRTVAGAMHQTTRAAAEITMIHFGFDAERLLVRIDAERPMVDLLADGREVSLKFVAPDGLRFSVRQEFGRLAGRFWRRQRGAAGVTWTESGSGNAVVAAGTILEIALPLSDLGLSGETSISFFLSVYDSADIELERHPDHRPIELAIPDEQFTGRQWRA